uniref:Uncharacterized protein n=1 Tax=Triatoma infestans TaxID=30076 RepID=A0A170XS93_TRIIF
MFVLMENV